MTTPDEPRDRIVEIAGHPTTVKTRLLADDAKGVRDPATCAASSDAGIAASWRGSWCLACQVERGDRSATRVTTPSVTHAWR